MTPKEKAEELFMRNFEITVDDYCAKQCALIAVDEILKVAFYSNDEIYDFYIEVKQELEKL